MATLVILAVEVESVSGMCIPQRARKAFARARNGNEVNMVCHETIGPHSQIIPIAILLKKRKINSFGDLIGERIFYSLPKKFVT